MLVSNDHEGRRYLERSVRMARDAGLDESVASAYGNLGSASGEIYDFEQADHYLEEGIAYCIERDLDFERNYMQAWLALSHLHQGRWSRASAIASTLLRYPGLSPISRIMAQVALGRIRARRGDPEAWPLLDEALEAARKTATLQRLGPVHSARAEAAWLEGDHDRTREEANQAFELAVRQGHQWFIGEMAYWRWKSGDLDDAPEGAAEPYALQMHGDARTAAARWSVLKCPYEAARAMAESDDISSVRLAFEELDSLGAVPARTAVAQRLRELGVQEVPACHAHHPGEPRPAHEEVIEVAELIARGCTNGQIAERLYISPKTVENHITAIFSKLEVDNRIEAVKEISLTRHLPGKIGDRHAQNQGIP
ncbi:MAG: LuxR C-terminal-related transcriptional regulator [Thermomicrobiales bacterium]